jgi:hypothetical protein
MREAAYSYVVLRYVHDAGTGESLNIGVLLYCPETYYVDAIIEKTYSRMSATFAGFDGQLYHRVRSEFLRGVERIRELMSSRPLLQKQRFVDAANIALTLWPDRGLSFRFGDAMGGISDDMPATTRHIFDRFVTSQFVRYDYRRRADEEVWSAIEPRFKPGAIDLLRPRAIKTRYGDQQFQRTFRNERLYVVEPLSLDYADAGSIVDIATIWRGRLDVIHGNSDESNAFFHLIVGKPKPEHAKQAQRALQMIRDARLQPEIHREDTDAPAFAEEFSDYILKHG